MDIWLDGLNLSEEESDWIGWQADRQAMTARGGRRVSLIRSRNTRRRKESNVYFKLGLLSVDGQSYAFSESVRAKLPQQQQQCGVESEIRLCVCVSCS